MITEQGIPERDWRLLRQLKPVVLERWCEKALGESVRLATTPDDSNYHRYLKLYRYVHQQDADLAAAFDDHRRSTARFKIAQIYALGLFTDAEFSGFSEETRNIVSVLTSANHA